MVASSIAEALNQAQQIADPEVRMKLALSQMRAIATQKFQRADRNTVGRVAEDMLKEMWDDPRFLRAFIMQYAQWEKLLLDKMNNFCFSVYRDMKNAPVQGAAGVQNGAESQYHPGASAAIPASAGEGSGVHRYSESQAAGGPAPSNQNEEEAIHTKPQSQVMIGPSSSSPDRNGGVPASRESQPNLGASIPSPPEHLSKDRSGEVRLSGESQHRPGLSAATPNRNAAVQTRTESHTISGRVVPIANRPTALADMQRAKAVMKPSMFETVSIRGTALVHMSRGTLKTIELKSVYDAALTRAILDHCVAPDSTMVRDLLKESDLAMYIENAKKEAEEVAKSHAA